jgi:Tol biopolymer transport system component
VHDLYLFDFDAGPAGFRLLRVNRPTASDSSPSRSRDGQLIALATDRAGETDLYL